MSDEKRVLEEIQKIYDEKFNGAFPEGNRLDYWKNEDGINLLFNKIKELIKLGSKYSLDYLHKMLIFHNGIQYEVISERIKILREIQSLAFKPDWLGERLNYELICYTKDVDPGDYEIYPEHVTLVLSLSETYDLRDSIMKSAEELFCFIISNPWDTSLVGHYGCSLFDGFHSEAGSILIEFFVNSNYKKIIPSLVPLLEGNMSSLEIKALWALGEFKDSKSKPILLLASFGMFGINSFYDPFGGEHFKTESHKNSLKEEAHLALEKIGKKIIFEDFCVLLDEFHEYDWNYEDVYVNPIIMGLINNYKAELASVSNYLFVYLKSVQEKRGNVLALKILNGIKKEKLDFQTTLEIFNVQSKDRDFASYLLESIVDIFREIKLLKMSDTDHLFKAESFEFFLENLFYLDDYLMKIKELVDYIEYNLLVTTLYPLLEKNLPIFLLERIILFLAEFLNNEDFSSLIEKINEKEIFTRELLEEITSIRECLNKTLSKKVTEGKEESMSFLYRHYYNNDEITIKKKVLMKMISILEKRKNIDRASKKKIKELALNAKLIEDKEINKLALDLVKKIKRK